MKILFGRYDSCVCNFVAQGGIGPEALASDLTGCVSNAQRINNSNKLLSAVYLLCFDIGPLSSNTGLTTSDNLFPFCVIQPVTAGVDSSAAVFIAVSASQENAVTNWQGVNHS
jgi:hypothetical protein